MIKQVLVKKNLLRLYSYNYISHYFSLILCILELFGGLQDLYIELYRDHDVFYTSPTQQQNHDRTVTWNLENIELHLSLNDLLDKKVKLRVKEKDLIKVDEVIGKAVLNCQEIVQGNGEVIELRDKLLTKKEEKNGGYTIKGRFVFDS